jgi:hypothetical protein
MSDIRRIAFCPHCGQKAPQLLKLHFTGIDRNFHEDGFDDLGDEDWWLAICETCTKPLLYRSPDESEKIEQPDFDLGDNEMEPDFSEAKLVWPRDPSFGSAVPEEIRRVYREAFRVKANASSFAVHIRKGLESICDHKGAVQGRLEKRLADLAVRSVIPENLAKAADVIRLLGNSAAHNNRVPLSGYDAGVIDGFFRAIVMYVYVLPETVRSHEEHLKQWRALHGAFARREAGVEDDADPPAAKPPARIQ